MSKWLELESVRRHISDAGDYLTSSIRRDFDSEIESALKEGVGERIESPLQAILYAWFEAGVTASTYAYQEKDSPDLIPERWVECSSGRKYRVDFALGFRQPDLPLAAERAGVTFAKIAVELDGHEFHERTPQQVEKRNQRDRELLADGWQVLHFSGTEIHRKPVNCVAIIVQAYDRALARFKDELVAAWVNLRELPDSPDDLRDRVRRALRKGAAR